MKYLALTLLSLLIFASCNTDDEPKPLVTQPLQEPTKMVEPPTNSMTTSMGTFSSFAHGLSGKAVLYTSTNNERTLRLENFNMTSGPDVYVFLSKANNYSAANTIPITMLKDGYINANLSLTLDNTVDMTTYKFVLVYCVQFNSLFGYAEPK